MRYFNRGTALLILFFAFYTFTDAQIRSVYTSVGEKSCKTVRTEPEEGAESAADR